MNFDLAKLEKELKLIADEEARESALERLLAIAKVYEGEDEVLVWPDLLTEFKRDTRFFSTGYQSLDNLLRGGIRPQQLIVVSALTKSGKTSFVVDMTAKLIDLKPLWLTFEESVEELSEKFEDRKEPVPEFISPKSMVPYNLKWVEEKIVEAIAKYGSKVVVVDHLDFVVPYNSDRHDLRVSEAMRALKGMARKWDIVIILICHLVKAKMDSQPTLEDLRGSAAIGQEADTVILLWREMKKEKGEVQITSNVNVSVQAVRRGKPGNIKMIFKEGRFVEEDWTLTEAEKDFEEKW
jgi:replicative DNA helicase